LIENSLRRQKPGFQKNFRLEGKIQTLGEGLFHENYIFEAGDQELVLRLAKVQKRCIWIEINFEPFRLHSNSGTARIQSPP
jgi:hypothetical protein